MPAVVTLDSAGDAAVSTAGLPDEAGGCATAIPPFSKRDLLWGDSIYGLVFRCVLFITVAVSLFLIVCMVGIVVHMKLKTLLTRPTSSADKRNAKLPKDKRDVVLLKDAA